MLGTLLNIAAITAGSALGIAAGARMADKTRITFLAALGAVTVVFGTSMGLKTANILVPLVGMVIGTLIGEALDLDGRLEAAGEKLKRRFAAGPKHSRFVEGFTTASILFCVGPMTVLGSIEDGLGLGIRLLAIKSLLDGIASATFAAALGIGVWFSVITVLAVQGSISLFAGALQGVMTPELIAELSACGGFMMIVIGLGLLGATKARATNMLPGLVVTPGIVVLLNILGVGWKI